MNEFTDNYSNVICPHCKSNITEEVVESIESSTLHEVFRDVFDDSQSEYICPKCQKEFMLYLHVYIKRWVTADMDD